MTHAMQPPVDGSLGVAVAATPDTVEALPPTALRMPRRPAQNPPPASSGQVLDLERYVPGFLTWIANKLSRGASQQYLSTFNVGIETWRCLVLLAIEGSISAQNVSRVTGMDKASVSRCFKGMQASGLITFSLDDADGRLRLAALTKKGRELHDQIIGVALERERAFLSVLSAAEQHTLIDLLKRLHENLPQVEVATTRYIKREFPAARAKRPVADREG